MIKIPRSGNFYFTLGFFILLLTMIITATNYGKRAAFFPFVIGIPTLLLVIIELVRDQSSKLSRTLETDVFRMKQHRVKEDGKKMAASQQLQKEATAIMLVIAFFLLLMLTGFLISIPVFIFCYILFFTREPWWKGLVLSAGTWVFVYLVFCVLMEIQFPWSYLL